MMKRRITVLLFATVFIAAAPLPSSGPDLNSIDNSIKPSDDFYRYANGSWLKANSIPAGRTSYDTRAILAERTSKQVRDLIRSAASTQATKGSVQQTVGDYYGSFMDVDTIEAKGLSPLADEMAIIAAIKDNTSLSSYLGTTLNSEVDGLTANADHIFGIWINQGFEDSEHNFPHIWQGGLGLPDRDNYLASSPEMNALRGQYKAHIQKILKIAGEPDPENSAAQILSLETKIAQAFRSRFGSRGRLQAEQSLAAHRL
jgi:predicted metalloendopeptidase